LPLLGIIGNWYGIKFPQIIATLLQNYLLIFLFHNKTISIFAQFGNCGTAGAWGVRGEARFPPFKENLIYNIKIFLHYITLFQPSSKNVIISHCN